ncbi:MAG TPA: sugar-binding protein, partial [Bacteroidota bacterium]|nr:sugar-binding protein [Bacteroidota bacterium]
YWGGATTDVEDWYFQSANVYDQDPGWKQLIIPLKEASSVGDQGFNLPGWSGTANNGKLDLDKIVGFTIEWTSGVLGGDNVAEGEIIWDKLQLLDYAYKPIYMFNDFAADTTNFKVTGAGGANGTGGVTLFKESVDTLASPSALGLNYKVNISETWGGYANMVYNLPAGSIIQDLSGNTAINMWVKVLQPVTSSSGKVENVMSLRFVLREGNLGDASAGGDEWYTRANVRLDSLGATLGWQQMSIPLNGLPGSWGEFANAPYAGFYAVNGSDGVMNLDKLKQIKIEFSASRDGSQPSSPSLVHSGKVLLSTIVPSGFRNTDKTPPAAVTGILATPGAYDNLITWTDVANEPSSTYNVYFSDKKFTDGAADATVEDIPPYNLPLGTQFIDHVLRAPVTDQNVSYYYGVTATDAAGNTNKTTTVIGPITNKAKGVPTINKTAPVNFKADGALTEWASISPIVLNAFRTPATAHMAQNGSMKDSLDISAKAYLAVDQSNLYVAFDVVDDTVSVDTSATDYNQDCPDLFIGLYDWRGKKHASYSNGKTPDYHFRFSQNRVYLDNGAQVVMYPGANYSWKKKALTAGYTVEAKIPFARLTELDHADSLFVPKEGMRIPIDFAINDRDSKADGTRDCILCYSPLANDNSWEFMYRWSYTWIGSQWTTGVTESGVVPATYTLEQNYPNPFNPATKINYTLAKPGVTTLKIFDVLGREVMTLVNEMQTAGNHVATFNATRLASGMYIYKLESGSFSSVKKMMFLK